LEIGCGTGQATVPLARRGLLVTAVEIGPALAEVARRRLAGFPSARVVTGGFEEWTPDGGPFHAVVAFNSLHWIDPEVRYPRSADLLSTGGVLVVASCRWARPPDAERFWFDVQEDYRAVGYEGEPPPPPDAIGSWHLHPEAGAHFHEVAARRYPFSVVYPAEDYLAILATQSGTRQLGEQRRSEFLDRVRARLAAWPRLTASFVGLLTVGRLARPAPRPPAGAPRTRSA
jgi:SAM-dependent methyltransferase